MHKTIKLEFENYDNSGEYKVEAICNSAVYTNANKSKSYLLDLYYLILEKDYSKEENTWELALIIQHLWSLVITFHKEHPKKPMATFPSTDSTLPIARPTIRPEIRPEALSTKQKHGQPTKAKGTSKCTKKS